MTGSTLRPVFVCVLSLLLVSVALGGVAATPDTPRDVDETSPTNDTEDVTNETTEPVDDTVENTTNDTEEVDDTVENTTNETDGTVDETTNETGNGVVDDAGDEVEETTNDTAETVDGVTNSSTVGDAVDGTTESVGDALVGTTETVGDAVDETTAALGGTVDDTADELTGTSDELDGGPHAAPATESGSTGATDPGRAVVSPTRAERPAGDRDAREAGAADGGRPRPGSDVSETTTGLLALVVLSSSVSGLPWYGVVGSLQRPGAVRGVRRVLRAGARLPWKYAVALQSDWRDAESLEHDHRNALYETIAETPGIHLSELGARSDLSLSSVRHHLRVLHRESLIETEKVRGKRRFYPVDAEGTRRVAALSDPTVRRLLDTLTALGEARNDRLADELDRSPSTVSHHLSSLEEEGLVVRERDGRTTVNRVAPAVERRLEGSTVEGDAAVSAPRSDD